MTDATAEDPSERPSDLPEEKVRDLLERFADGARKVGLYYRGGLVQEDDRGDGDLEPGEERHHHLLVQFAVGDIAFSDRVQDPEKDKIDTTLREMERGDASERLRAILDTVDPETAARLRKRRIA